MSGSILLGILGLGIVVFINNSLQHFQFITAVSNPVIDLRSTVDRLFLACREYKNDCICNTERGVC